MLFGRREYRETKEQLAQLQHMVNAIAVNTQAAVSYAGNPYPDYGSQVVMLEKMYLGKAKWGGIIARNLIDMRAAFSIGNGISVTAREGVADAKEEIKFINALMARNAFDREGVQDWAREAEIEGKFLARIAHAADGGIDVRFVSWTAHQYQVTSAADDYADYTQAAYSLNGEPQVLEPAQFVYKRFGGRVSQVNECPPKLGALLWNIENMHRAMNDWRALNRLFGVPTPHFQCATDIQAKELLAQLRTLRWRVGQFIASTGAFSLVGPPSTGIESLRSEIENHAKIISGGSGVPVHFLGFPELMSNRATADNLMELVYSSTSRERNVWIGAFDEIFEKSLSMSNAVFGTTFNPKAVKATVNELSSARRAELAEMWIPLHQEGVISRQTLLEHVPDVDPEQEAKRMQVQETDITAAALKSAKDGLGIHTHDEAEEVTPAKGAA